MPLDSPVAIPEISQNSFAGGANMTDGDLAEQFIKIHARLDQLTPAILDSEIPSGSSLYKLGDGKIVSHKHAFDALVEPGPNDDSASGYTWGSTWFLRPGRVFFCVDPAPAAARWLELPGIKHDWAATSDPGPEDGVKRGYGVGSCRLNRGTGAIWICSDASPELAKWSMITSRDRDSFTLYEKGTAAAATEVGGVWEAPRRCVILRTTFRYKTAGGTSGSTDLDFMKNGASIYSAANKPSILFSATKATVELSPPIALKKGDEVGSDVLGVPTGGAPADLSTIVTVEYVPKHGL